MKCKECLEQPDEEALQAAYAEGRFLVGTSPQGTEIRWGLPTELSKPMGIFGQPEMGLAVFLASQILEYGKAYEDIRLWIFSTSEKWLRLRQQYGHLHVQDYRSSTEFNSAAALVNSHNLWKLGSCWELSECILSHLLRLFQYKVAHMPHHIVILDYSQAQKRTELFPLPFLASKCPKHNILPLFIAPIVVPELLNSMETFVAFRLKSQDAACLGRAMGVKEKLLGNVPPKHFTILRDNVSNLPVIGRVFDLP